MVLPFVRNGVFEEFEVHEDRIVLRSETGILCRGCRRAQGGAVVIKLPDEDVSDEILRSCRREALVFEQHPHECILGVLGQGRRNGRPYFALENFNGDSLGDLLKGGHRFSTEEILLVANGVGRALRAASDAGIVHGAIRPSTVILTTEGVVKVVGYGTPRCVVLSPDSPTYLSSLRYQSPEQVQGEPLSLQSDLYSLGILLYLLATGKTPFDGFDSAISLQYQVSYVDPGSPRKAGALIPAELERLILRCLEKKRETRTPTPLALLEELSALQASALAPELPENDCGDFEIFDDQALGEGGMGSLYRGRQVSLGRPVAIKVIREILTGSPDYVQRFRREAELLAQVNDPSIVQVFGTGTWRGRLFYAMELVDGKDLAVLLDEGRRFDLPELLDIAEGVAQALKAAWTYKIVHRDIKPSNILLTPDGRVKVADFGLAKSLRIPRHDSQLIAGTSEYISPEQAIGLKVDVRADLYSLGVVLYELASGQPPFRSDESFTGVVYHHVHTPPPALSVLAPQLPTPVADLIHRCLCKDPAGRCESPEQFLEEVRGLRRALRLTGVPKPEPRGPWERARSALRHAWRRRWPPSMKAASMVAIVAAGAVLSGLAQEFRRRDPDSSDRKAFELALGLGDHRSALRLARLAFGPESKEAREAEVLDRESGLHEKERNARACLVSEDWENAAAWFRLLEAEAPEPERRRFTRALGHCESLARGRRFERDGARESALAVYRALLGQGSPFDRYLRERIDALEAR